MENRELIELASQKVGGLSELARTLKWDKGSIAAIKSGRQSMPAYRAAQLAALLGHDEQAAYLKALAAQAKTVDEKNYWLSRIARNGALGCPIKVVVISLLLTTLQPSKEEMAYIFKKNPEYTLCAILVGHEICNLPNIPAAAPPISAARPPAPGSSGCLR